MGKKENTEIKSAENLERKATPRVADPFIGRTIGNCEIIEKINEGGTAYIYRGHNTRFDLDRVVKILKPSLIDEEDFYFRFRQEAQLTARLDHPNILRVFDTGEIDGYFYIEMEYISGQTLREYIQENPKLNEREILSLTQQITRALDYAHHAEISAPNNETITGILHRDIKPENIMLTPGKLVKLMDFGAAKPLNITSNTMQGMIVGTFHYMSPEQLKGGNLDLRSDFFSLGIVMYEMCTGQKPFIAENLTELIEKITACKYAKLHALRPSISPMTEELIDKLLSKDSTHRPAQAREIEEAIQISAQMLNSWAAGRKAKVPFSIKRLFPTVSLIFSTLALVLSAMTFLGGGGKVRGRETASNERTNGPIQSAMSLLEKGRSLEKQNRTREAANMYEMVAPPRDGGPANEYLEAQIRLANLCFTYHKQITKALSILESLRRDYSDPAIDAYLGQIYFKKALYLEAVKKFDTVLATRKTSVIGGPESYLNDVLYYLAFSLDKQYIYVDRKPAYLMEAIKAWNYYLGSSNCEQEKTPRCKVAYKHLAELEKIDKQINSASR
ncbi:MAG: protein kinase [Chitinivibrionales bacterium]|nr:protein kinase [Chitinivibrionales bacterium]